MASEPSKPVEKLRRGPWHQEEDELLTTFVTLLGSRRWDYIAKVSGLKRSGKSCRLRWLNYLRPNIKHGHISAEEEQMILQLHARWGNKWARIARTLPGRTDNEIKNYWRTYLRRKEEIQEPGDDQHEEKDGGVVEECSIEDYVYETPVEILELENENCLSDAAGSSDFAVGSPYENKITEWISEYTNEEIEMKYHHEVSSSLKWVCEDGDLWGSCSYFLWNMD